MKNRPKAPNQVKTASQDANAAPEFRNHNWAPSKPEKCRPLSLPSGKNGAQRCKCRPTHDDLDYPPTKDCALLARNAAL